MKAVYLALCAALLINSFQAAAGVVIGGTRLVYPGGKKEATITVKNPDDIPYLVQSWVNADLEGNVKAPFLVTPPLFRLNGGKENTLRVVKTAQPLPEDRESVFWFSVKTVPPEAEGKGNHLQIAVRTRIKLFYRPASLPGSPEEAAGKVRWERSGNTLKAINDSPYYLSFSTVSVAGEKNQGAADGGAVRHAGLYPAAFSHRQTGELAGDQRLRRPERSAPTSVVMARLIARGAV